MGNRFKEMPQYHSTILAHGVIASITFLFIVPAAIFTARFYGRSPGWALRWHIYLQILTVAFSTVVFILGWFAVGPARSLTNPHHGIGLAIYVLVLVQAIGGCLVHRREKGKTRRKLPIRLVLHQWIGRAVALLGIAQVPLGLTLYGSPKFTFILYTLWMTFLLVLYFVLSYRALPTWGGGRRESSHGGTVIEDRKPSRFGGFLGPLAAGAGAAALLGARRKRGESRSRSRSRSRRDEVVPSRRGSGSYIEEEKYQSRRKESGTVNTLFKVAGAVGAGALVKSMWDRRQRKKEEDDYSAVAPDTPSRRHGRQHSHYSESEISEESRMEQGRRPRTPLLPGPGNPVAAAAALSAAEPRPHTPRPLRSQSHGRRTSYDSGSYYDSQYSPSRAPKSNHGVRNSVLAGLGMGWIAKRMKDRRDKKELDRLDRIEAERIESERQARHGSTGPRLTGDGFPSPARRQHRPQESYASSDLSSILDDPHTMRPGASVPPIPAALAGGAAGAALAQSRSRHDITEPVAMPPAPPDPQGVLHQDSESETYESAGGRPQRRPSERRRRAGEKAAAEAVAAAAGLAAEQEAMRHRSRSRGGEPVNSPPVSVKVKLHGDKDRNVTLRRLTEEEAAAERAARKTSHRERRKRADSLSSMSGTDTAASNRRYRRAERAAEKEAEARLAPPPPVMAPLDPPNPAFAGGRKPKDSAYYSGRPGESSAVGAPSVGSPESHGTWSGMSPGSGKGSNMSEDAAERRRRRRLERNQRPTGTVDFS